MADEARSEELEKLFVLASEFVRDLRDLNNEGKLKFYGLFKQATDGPCTKKRPAMWDMKGCAKWDSWKRLGTMSKETAMENYINELTRLQDSWEYDPSDNAYSETYEEPEQKSGTGMGVSVSTMYREEQVLKDENKTVFDWCKEGNVNEINKLVERNIIDVNALDEQNMTLLHWACDRGHDNIVEYLIKTNADINCQDSDGQTPLHFAVICEFDSIVQILVRAGANKTLTDSDGNIPLQLTTDTKLVEMLS